MYVFKQLIPEAEQITILTLTDTCWVVVLVVSCCCCCLFFISCSADLRSSSVTPWVERRVERTIFAWAFLWVSLSSSRLGGTNDLYECTRLHIRLHSVPSALCGTSDNHSTDFGRLFVQSWQILYLCNHSEMPNVVTNTVNLLVNQQKKQVNKFENKSTLLNCLKTVVFNLLAL